MPVVASVKDESFEVISQLKKMFRNQSGNYIYIGQQNPKISEKLRELKSIPQKGAVRSLLQKSILSSILELEIAQHSSNYATMIAPIMNLATRQIDELKRISGMNFSEVVHSIGFSRKNYFPRLFRERYHTLSKNYSQNSLAKTA
jgi:AraC-like DNA-binding protein